MMGVTKEKEDGETVGTCPGVLSLPLAEGY
jgi:hypothetical protein